MKSSPDGNKRTGQTVFIRGLVNALGGAFPPEMEQIGNSRAKSLRRKGVEALLTEVDVYSALYKPGLFGRFFFGRRLQQSLITAGYSPGFARQVTTAALANLTRPTGG